MNVAGLAAMVCGYYFEAMRISLAGVALIVLALLSEFALKIGTAMMSRK